MKNALMLAALAFSGLGLTACATDSYDPGNAAQGGPVNRQAPSVAESACMAAVNRQYGGKERELRVISSEFSQANSLVMIRADGERWRCLVSNDGYVEDLSLER